MQHLPVPAMQNICGCSTIMILPSIFVIAVAVLSVQGQTCTLGRTDLQPSVPNPNPGLFIQEQGRAPCDGQIIGWTVCYYDPRAFTRRESFQISLEVWRNVTLRQLNIVGSNSVTVELPNEVEDFQCVKITVDPAEHINVQQNDFLGVYATAFAVLPVVSANAGGSGRVFFFQVTATPPGSVFLFGSGQPLATQLANHAVHITATIETGTATTMTEDVTTPPSSPAPSTSVISTFLNTEQTEEPGVSTEVTQPILPGATESASSTSAPPTVQGVSTTDGNLVAPQSGSTGLSAGGVAALVIVLLMTLVVGAIVGTVALTLLARRRSQEEKNKAFTIDNAVYDIPELATGNGGTSYHNMSTVSSYEVPLNTFTRQIRSQPVGEGPGNNGTLDRGFVDSFTSDDDDDEGSEVVSQDFTTVTDMRTNSACSSFNPYATLSPVVLQGYYNMFLRQQEQQHQDQEYSVPNAEGAGLEAPYREPPNSEEEIYRELSKRTLTISRHTIQIKKKIGEGAFSIVSKGTWTRGSTEYDVAVKELIQQSSEEDKIRLLKEAAVMGQFHHPNIVKLFGVVKHGNSPMIVTEFLHKSDLLNALNAMAPDPGQLVEASTPEVLLNYSQQVALGMHYLSSKGFVHRDLAARNIFVTRDDICKVGDFGLSRELANTDYYVSRGGVVPVRWTAPEAIFYRKYSSASDVWSYGCLLYEIWTMGMRPYEGIATNKYLETLQAGYRLPPPPGCPRVIYSVMIKSWHPSASDRPTFGQFLTTLLKNRVDTLSIPTRDASTHPKASLLCAGLEAGLDMYKDLQNMYIKSTAKLDHQGQTSRTSVTDQTMRSDRYLSRIENEYEMEENGEGFGGGGMGSQNHLLAGDAPSSGPPAPVQENLYDSVEHGNDVYYNPNV